MQRTGYYLGILIMLVCAACPAVSRAQAVGSVAGVVVEAETGRGLAGANVYLEATAWGSASDLSGRFDVRGVKPGDYVLIVSLLGYEGHRLPVRVQAGEAAHVEVHLTSRAIDLGSILAQADRPYSAASSRTLRAFDLRTRPVRSSQDLLRLAPGLVTAQHAGGGKAEQIFLRGFDADHGTDVHLSVDGMPVNMVSHGHGQGYADLHFVIPDVVEQIDVHKGPYEARFGNFATAGAVAFTTRDHLDHNLIRLEGGSFHTTGLTALYQIPLPGMAHQGAYLAGQYTRTDGPFDRPQGFQRFNLFGKFHTHLGENTQLALSASGFGSAWDASGQIPQRAVEQGRINRFGSVDDFEGGTTGRQDVNMTYETHGGNQHFRLQGYTTRYDFKLFSNFTFFLDDPAQGDMIEQTDKRQIVGLNGEYRFTNPLGNGLTATVLGGGFRADNIAVTLWHSPNRVRLDQLVGADITERNLYLWAQEEWIVSPRLRLLLGLRGDYLTYNVDDALEAQPAELPHASGYAHEAVLSPKLNVVLSPTPALDVFINAGTGFHSNDARDVVIGQRIVDLANVYRREGLDAEAIDARLDARHYDAAQQSVGALPRAVGGEVGFRTRWKDRYHLSAAGWLLDLDREFVYVGDGGYTELSGRSRRYGLDVEARVRLASWLSADADLNLAHGVLRDEPDGANAIPLAPRVTSTGGITVIHPRGIEGSLRYRYIGDRPANEDGTVVAEGYALLDVQAAYPIGAFRVQLTVENLLDAVWNEAQFDTESRLPGEAAPVSELHFTPGNPRSFRLGIAYLF